MLIQKGNRTYSGFESDLPGELPSGSIFISTDTTHIYIYNDDSLPILLNGPMRFTRSETELIINSNGLLVGKLYTITDADVNLYGGTEITLTAITPSELSLQGSGLFYCPKYDLSGVGTGYGIWTKYMEGTFTNISGTFTPGETVTAQNGATAIYLAEGFLNYVSGDWSGATTITAGSTTANVSGFVSPSYSVGQIVHWGGKSWTNVNGNIGASIDKYTLDAEWTEIPFNATDYNVYIDEIQYDFGNDMIIYRKDRYNNIVSGSSQVFVEFNGYNIGNPIKDFQWGCGIDTDDYFYIGIQGNQVIDSYFETLNSLVKYIWFNELSQFSYFISNTFSSGSYFQNNTLSGSSISNNTLSGSGINYNTLSSSNIQYNTLGSNSYINYNTLSSGSHINNNTLSNGSNIQYNTLSNSSIQYNTLSNSYINNNTLSNGSNINNNTLSSGSHINNNTLSNGSNIQYNTLSNSSIQYNTLSNSYINNNTLSNGSNINNNTLSSGSHINNNTLSNGSNIQYNTLSNSYINNNTLSNGSRIQNNTLSSSSRIQYNTLSNGSNIQYNTLSSSSYIQNNTLSGSRIQNTILSGSYIINNTLSSSNIQYNTLSNSSLLQFSEGDVVSKTLTRLTMEGNNTSISITATIIFNQNISKTIFKREDGTSRLQYVNNSDNVVITDINT